MRSDERIAWSESYSVDNTVIDDEHKRLISMISRLMDLAENKDGTGKMGSLLIEMTDYAIKHFKTEEEHMENMGFPKLEEHKLLHRRYSDKVLTFTTEYLNRDSLTPIEVVTFLKEWWTDHILGADREYAAFNTRSDS